jgi:hypothetical protein
MTKASAIFTFALFASGIILQAGFTADEMEKRFERVANNSIETMDSLKRECEKSLPRDKECVMVFDFIPAEADYE